MGQGSNPTHNTALDMLNAFRSVGTKCFDVTWTNVSGDKQQFRRGIDIDKLDAGLPRVLNQAEIQHQNLIVRPHTPPVFLQLDDLDASGLEKVRQVSFLTLVTSPGNHQAWLALAGPADGDFARRVRKAAGADLTASGATRIAGSLNFKPKYAPAFPRVAIDHLALGKRVLPTTLEAMHLVAAKEPLRASDAISPRPFRPASQRWPNYGRCLDDAPANHSGSGPDVSRADFTFAMIAASWGWSVEDVASRPQLAAIMANVKSARLTSGPLPL